MDYQYSDNKFNYIVSIFLFFIFSQQVKSQHTDDIGFFLGGSFYMGDMNPDRLFYNPAPAYGIKYRFNYNPLLSMSYGLTRGKLNADDADFKSDLFQHYRNAKLRNNYINELSAQVEYNFYPVTGDKPKTEKFSPYVKFGLAIGYGEKISPKIQMFIPFGLGLKYKVTRKVELSLDWAFRRTFTDKLDNVSQYYTNGIFVNRQRSFSKTRDWYSFFGINLHYSLKKTNFKCPAYSNIQ